MFCMHADSQPAMQVELKWRQHGLSTRYHIAIEGWNIASQRLNVQVQALRC